MKRCSDGRKRGLTGTLAAWARAATAALATTALATGSARAEASSDAYAVLAREPADQAALEAEARRWLKAQGRRAQPVSESGFDAAPGGVPPEGLEVLSRLEDALRTARELSARFDERGALRTLEGARKALLEHLEIPHAHAWLSEVELAIALCAAQLGELGLAETALTRATSLEPTRKLEAGEAAPTLLSWAERVRRAHENAPMSQVRIEAEPAGATLTLDGRELGPAPVDVAVRSGPHVLSVRAGGHVTYARLVDFGPGRRLPVHVQLAPEPREEARLGLLRALREGAPAQPAAERFSRQSASTLWLFSRVGPDLMRVERCAPVCEVVSAPRSTRPLAEREQPARADREQPFWRRWPVWAVGAAVVASGVVAALLATRNDEVRRGRELVLDPGEIPP